MASGTFSESDMNSDHIPMTPAEVATWLASDTPPRLLDVREVDEHEIVALPGSTLIPLSQIPERISEIASWKEEDVVVYCHHGVRSLHAITWLRQHGFTKLRNLSGGIDRWSMEIDPTLPRY